MKRLIILFVLLLSSINTYSQEANPLSKVSCYVEIYHDNKKLGNATGFFFNTATKTYFITNNHVVGGEFFKNEYVRLHNHALPIDSTPNKITVRIYRYEINNTFNITLPIDQSCIKFYNDAAKNNLMDVVAIPINDAIKIQLNNTVTLSSQNISADLLLAPSSELFIVGFPYDFAKFGVYPIWKRGTIASEPNLRNVNNSQFWIDATTRAGMSGSPVFFRGSSYATAMSPNTLSGQINTFLVGIYSAQNYQIEIGIVWDLHNVIEELNKLN
ncbi:MAG: serine protease [Bacteroidota bacterium]|nr:serine protease [Bacteroidota bacterium]